MGAGGRMRDVSEPIELCGRVTVWKIQWLPASETFVRNQMSGLRRWTATALGLDRVSSPISRPTDVIVPVGVGLLSRRGGRRKLLKAIEESRPDVLHAHFAMDAYVLLRLIGRSSYPTLVTLHGVD